MLLISHPIPQSTDHRIPGHKYSMPGPPGTKFLAHQVLAIWFIVRRLVWDAVMPGALVVDKMGDGKTFTSVAVAMLCILLTEKDLMGLPLSILWKNMLEDWVELAQNNFPGISGDDQQGYPFQRQNQCHVVYSRSRQLHRWASSAYIIF
jgi:hypothetical protein